MLKNHSKTTNKRLKYLKMVIKLKKALKRFRTLSHVEVTASPWKGNGTVRQ